MWVCVAQHGRHSAVEVPADGDFLGRGFGVHVDDDDADVFGKPLEFLVDGTERIVDRRHEDSALNVQNRDRIPGSCLDDDAPASGVDGGIVGRTQQPGFGIQVWKHFLPVPNVISRGQDVHTPAKELVGDFGRHAEARGCVLAVDDHEVDVHRFPDRTEMLAKDLPTSPGNQVADE